MSHSTIYRICLLVVVILTIIGGIFYYIHYMEENTKITEGTLVKEGAESTENPYCTTWNQEYEKSEGMSWLETQKQYIIK